MLFAKVAALLWLSVMQGKFPITFKKSCSSTMAECDARKVSNYFQELEQGAIKLSCQEKEHRQDNV